MSTEQRELDLVEKVDLRILGVSNNEEKLQQLLKLYLPPLLLKAGSEHASVRNKVIAICHRLNTFIQPPGIILPVAALLDQYKAAESPLVKHFDLIFIQHSVSRLDPVERRALISKAVKGIGSDRGTGVASLFNVFFRLLQDLKLPQRGSKEDTSLREDVGLSDPTDAKFVAEWLGKLLLLRANVPGAATSPGLTEADVAFLTLSNKPDTWHPSAKGLSLPETRIKAVAFLSSGAFTDEERFIPAIYAAASSDFRISGVGDDMIKRSSVSLEDKELVKKLFDAHTKLSPPYRIRILGLLSKSEVSTTFPDEILAAFRQNVTTQPSPDSNPDAMQVDAPVNTKATTGLELTKVHRALFEYINWVARIGPSKTDFSKIGPPLISLLRDFIEAQGWPKPDAAKTSLDNTTLRSRAYETIGVLAKGTSSAMSFADRMSLTGWLFRSLSEDPTPNVVINIDGALSSFSGMLKDPPPTTVKQLRSLLLSYMTLVEGEGDVVRSARHAAARWANTCLAFDDVMARWIDIMAVAGRRDERSDVVEEGQKGLDPWTYYANASFGDGSEERGKIPSWQDMVQTFFVDPIALSQLNSSAWIHGNGDGMDVDQPPSSSTFANFPGEVLAAFPVAVDYCKRILFLTALGKDFKIEPGWERQLGTLVQSDLASRRTIRKYLASETANRQATYHLLHAAFEGMLKEDRPAISMECARAFVDLASFVPRVILRPLVSRAGELLTTGLVKSNNKDLRVLGARAFGMLAAHPANAVLAIARSKKTLVDASKGLLEKGVVGAEMNTVEGAFLTLGYFLSRLRYYGTTEVGDGFWADLNIVFPRLDVVAAAGGIGVSTLESLWEAYGQLWTAGVKITGDEDEEKFKETLEKGFIEPLVLWAKKGNEKAISALGKLAISLPVKDTDSALTVGDENRALLGLVLQKLFALYEIKQAEVHFSVGEAITSAIACWDADVVQLAVDVETSGDAYRASKRPNLIKAVLQKLLVDCKTTKPSLLKASGIWLFCIIQYCSHLEEVQSRLRECQVAFMRLLSARDELVQETASRGLGLVYEKGDPELKEQLVRDLVSSFTGSGPKLQVDDETELFEAGALPTGEGKSITSYKDILSLANEVGDQSLVYKFMSLATNAATWSTRSAFGRFGLSSILSESEVDPKLYPKLYRYRFDPNQNVQKSMNDIWKALVKDSNAVIETHFDDIMRDLLKSILGKEWRVREASCVAISDLISGRPFPKYEPYYKEIWAAALKVLDDVKGTVRKAALHLCIALSTTLVRQLDESGSSSAATAMMKEALPFLLSEKGIESGVEDVKVFATITVIKIAKTGGKSLNPYIATTVPHLLGILSTIEPEAINYYYQRSGEDNREKIDKLRTTMVSQSPISEAIENLLRSVDKEVMANLAPKLEETINSAVGMPTKIGCSRVLSTLATRHSNDFAPYAARFLQLMEKQVLDRNDEVSQGYARAASYIIRAAPDEARLRFVARLQKLYLDSEDEVRRQKVADAVLALSKISPDHFNALEGQLLPFAFFAKHDTDHYAQKAFEEVWSKHAGSALTVTRYIPEIVNLVKMSLDTAQWALRHSGGITIADAVASVVSSGGLSGTVNLTSLEAIWPQYEKALAMKTFDGKEKLLEPFPDFVAKTKPLWQARPPLAELLKKIALREAKRNNAEYRPHAFRCLWRFAAARDDLDLLSDIVAIVSPYMDLANADDDDDPDAMDIDDKPGSTSKSSKAASAHNKARGLDPRSKAAWAAIEAIAKGYNRAKMSVDPMAELLKIATAFEQARDLNTGGGSSTSPSVKSKEFASESDANRPYLALSQFAAIRRAYWYECAGEVLAAASEVTNDASIEEGKKNGGLLGPFKWFLATLDLSNGADVGTEDQRLARAKAAGAALTAWTKHLGRLPSTSSDGEEHAAAFLLFPEQVEGAVNKALREERSATVQAKWKEALGLLKEMRKGAKA